MDKARRAELVKLKFKKRLRRLGLVQTHPKQWICYQKQTRPCNCSICRKAKYSRKMKHKGKQFEE